MFEIPLLSIAKVFHFIPNWSFLEAYYELYQNKPAWIDSIRFIRTLMRWSTVKIVLFNT